MTITCLCFLLHSVLVGDHVNIEVLDKGIVTACLMPKHRQQLKQGSDLVSVVTDEVDVAFGKPPRLQ